MSELWICSECGRVVDDIFSHLSDLGLDVDSDEYHNVLSSSKQLLCLRCQQPLTWHSLYEGICSHCSAALVDDRGQRWTR